MISELSGVCVCVCVCVCARVSMSVSAQGRKKGEERVCSVTESLSHVSGPPAEMSHCAFVICNIQYMSCM